MMKTFISLLLLTYSLKAQTIPTVTTGALASYKCQTVAAGANSTTNITCAACFNWSTQTRAYNVANASICSTVLTTGLISDCNMYSGYQMDTISAANPNHTSCLKCSKTYYNVTQATSSTGNMSATCSDSKGTGCTGKVDNCFQTVCMSKYSSTTLYSSQFCRFCKSGYVPAELDLWDAGAVTCEKGDTPNNCKYLAASTSAAGSASCVGCNKNFALAGASSTCVGFNSDENCNRASSTDDGCMSCWNAYYFNGATCALRSKIFMLGVFALMGLIASIN